MGIKQSFKYFVLSCFTASLVACSQSSTTDAVSDAASDAVTSNADSGFDVAVVLPGPKDDGSWSEIGYDGAQLIESELSVPVEVSESVAEESAEQVFRDYAESGSDFIIGFGSEFADELATVAEDFPRTKFAVINGENGNNRNLGVISINADESGYLSGVIAATQSQTNKVAYVAGESYPHIQSQVKFFQQGAQSVNADITATGRFVESWSDAEKGKAIGEELIAEGYDVIVVNADVAGLPIHELAQAANIYTIGWSLDQRQLAPDTILTSILENFPIAMLEASGLAQTGRWEGKKYKFGLQEGVNALAPFNDALNAQSIDQILSVKEGLATGEVALSAE